MTPREAIAFVKAKGIVLESARGPAPSLAAAIAGEPIRGSWWGHRKARQILHCSRAVRDSKDVLVCRLLGGKVTYVHRRLWPALARLQKEFDPARLSAIREIHMPQGKHETTAVAFSQWLPPDVLVAAASLTVGEATKMLEMSLGIDRPP